MHVPYAPMAQPAHVGAPLAPEAVEKVPLPHGTHTTDAETPPVAVP